MGALTEDFFKVYRTVEELSKEKADMGEMKGVLEAFKATPEYESEGVRGFTPDVYKRLLVEYRKRAADKKKNKNVNPNGGAQATVN